VLNTGAAFGLFAGQRALFIAVGSLLFIVTAVYYRYIVRQGIFFQIGVSLFLGGALGNLIDRIRFGQVVDFLDFRIWPVFNIADIAICLGAGFILLFVLRSELQE
jgi:signal peptidase II